jgi:polyisoprenyl-phosphate glycosyltransferase
MQPILTARYSLVVPVYRNAESIDALVETVRGLQTSLDFSLETIFVVDGSPDDCHSRLRAHLETGCLQGRLIMLSRNFGAFAAIREGLLHAVGDYAAVMAADLQEPPQLILEFFRRLEEGEGDIAFGVREARADPFVSRLLANAFWWIYRRFVQREVPDGGVDVFAVNRAFLDRIIAFEEANSSLLALLFWIGGRRIFVPYARSARQHGKSAWTFRKKLTYLLDSVFAFTDAPIRLLLAAGSLGLSLSVFAGIVVLIGRLLGWIDVPGYAGTMLAVLFFGALNALGLGLVGNYAWRAYENTKRRPLSIVMDAQTFQLDLKIRKPDNEHD